MALVHAELREALLPSVLVRPADDPGGRVADAEVENFTRRDHVVEGVHDFRDRGGEVPPVYVEQIDVACPEFLQTRLQRDPQALGVITHVVRLDHRRCRRVTGAGELSGED